MKLAKIDRIVVFCRDVIEAFLQSLESKQIILYKPPFDILYAYFHPTNYEWRAHIQIYGEAEAGLYCHKTLVPWIIRNIPNLQQSIFDSSLLFRTKKIMEILLCTVDTLVVIPESVLQTETAIKRRFKCHERQLLPSNIEGVYLSQDSSGIVLPQMAYLNTKGREKHTHQTTTKADLLRELTDEGQRKHRTAVGRLAWIATGTYPTCTILASVAL